MPELPEVRAHAERLTDAFGGATLAALRPLSFAAVKTAVPPVDAPVGRLLDRVDQRGKYLLLRFGDLTHVVHLMQGGRLEPDAKQSRKPRGGLCRWVFDDDRALLLTEAGTEHRAGVWTLEGETEGAGPLEGLGPDADSVDADDLSSLLGQTNERIHGWLRDQRHLAGIGRRLANEVCYRAKLSPFATTGKLGADDSARLVEAIRGAVDEGLEFERGRPKMSSSADRPGSVHGRAGETCPGCGDELRSVTYRKYTVVYCPTEQTGGKVLADNTTSKFLK